MRRTFSILFLLTVSILILQSADSSPTDWLQNELLQWDQSIFQVDISPKGRFYAVSGYQDVELYDIRHQLIWHNRGGFVQGQASRKPIVFSPDGDFLCIGNA